MPISLVNFIIYLLCSLNFCYAVVLVANEDNFQTLIGKFGFTLIKYSADWCHFSQMLSPIFDETSEKIANLTDKGVAALLTVDCEHSQSICVRENINKYPTLKATMYGKLLSKEYRGQRTVDAFVNYINEHINYQHPSIDGQMKSVDDFLKTFETNSNSVIGLIKSIDSKDPFVEVFSRVATVKRDKCDFHLVYNLSITHPRIIFGDSVMKTVKEFPITDKLDFAAFHDWVSVQATPLVRELTFTNAEEITEERLPLLLLFYHPNNKSLISKFNEFIKLHLMHQRTSINFLVADGFQFTHPLSHIGKAISDLPLIVIDSFAHMYIFPKSIEMAFSGDNLNKFIEDFKSGKLHLEFHYGTSPDASSTAPSGGVHEKPTTPVESVFRLLAPSRKRYTILHDEF